MHFTLWVFLCFPLFWRKNMKNKKIDLKLLLFWNLKYIYRKYFLTHVLFCLPHLYVINNMPEYRDYSGVLCVSLWFAYGLYKTTQPIFVGLIAVLFISSQIAYDTGYHLADLLLTLTCVLIMCVKQYYGRYSFGLRTINEDLAKNSNKLNN